MAKVKTTDPDSKKDAVEPKEAPKEAPVEESQENKVPLSKREVNISFNPMKIVKFVLVIALLVGVFYLGRVTASGTGDGISGFATGVSAMFAEDGETELDAPEAEKEEVVEEEPETLPEEPEEEEAEVVEKEPEVKEDLPPEQIITTYNNVEMTLDDREIEWKGTWGKLREVTFSIKNNERGTILPDYVKIHIQGYDVKAARRAEIHPVAKEIRSGQKLTQIRTRLESPYSYSPTAVGDLFGVPIVVFLYDANDNLIMSATSNMNLQG
jgi:hypothetical protein